MLMHPHISRSFWRPALWRPAAFVAVLLGFFNLALPAVRSDEQVPPNTVEEFRQFLHNDMDRLGKLTQAGVDATLKESAAVRERDEKKAAYEKEKAAAVGKENDPTERYLLGEAQRAYDAAKDKYDYYAMVRARKNADIKSEVQTSKATLERLMKQLQAPSDLAGVLRLKEWNSSDTRAGVAFIEPKLQEKISDRFVPAAREVVEKGDRDQKAGLCVMIGEEASRARSQKQSGIGYRRTLAKLTPSIVDLSTKSTGPDNVMVRLATALALANLDKFAGKSGEAAEALEVPAQERIDSVKPLLDESDLTIRRRAYVILATPIQAVSPRYVMTEGGSNSATSTDVLLYRSDAQALLKKQAGLSLPLLAKGLKDKDVQIRQTCLDSFRDITALLLDQVQLPPKASRDAPYFEIVKANRDLVVGMQVLLEQISNNSDVIVASAQDSDPTVRMQGLALLNDLAECRARVLGWKAFLETPVPVPKPGGGEVREKLQLQALLTALQPPGEPAQQPLPDALAPGLRRALAVLEKNLSDPDATVRFASIGVLENLGDEAKPVLPALIRALSDKDRFVRWSAVRIISGFGPVEPKTVVPALIQLVAIQDSDLAKAVGPALAKYGKDAAPAVPALVKTLESPVADPDLRIAYLDTLASIGEPGVAAIPAIIRLLKPQDVRLNTPTPNQPLAFVPTELFKFEDPRVRAAAADALGRFGTQAAKAEPELRAALEDDNADVRKAAGEALLRVNGK